MAERQADRTRVRHDTNGVERRHASCARKRGNVLMSDHTRKPNASRLFRDECVVCDQWAAFTGRFEWSERFGWWYGLFYCPQCKETYRVYKQGLVEAWRERGGEGS